MNTGLSFQIRLYGLVISRLYWLRELYFQAPQLLAAVISAPLQPWYALQGLVIALCCWKVTIAVYVNNTILGYRLKNDATSSQNMGRFGPGLVRPGRFGLILSVGRFSRKGESFRPWVVSVLDQFGPISIGRINLENKLLCERELSFSSAVLIPARAQSSGRILERASEVRSTMWARAARQSAPLLNASARRRATERSRHRLIAVPPCTSNKATVQIISDWSNTGRRNNLPVFFAIFLL